jgi:hypothetical protein
VKEWVVLTKRMIGCFLVLVLGAAACSQEGATAPGKGQASAAISPGGGASSETASSPAAPTDPLVGEWRADITCREAVQAVMRAKPRPANFDQFASSIPDEWGAPHQSPNGDPCRSAPTGAFEWIARFQGGHMLLFGPPTQALGLDATYELADHHTFTASDGGQNIPGDGVCACSAYTFQFNIEGDQVTFDVKENDAFFIAAWEAAPFVRTP